MDGNNELAALAVVATLGVVVNTGRHYPVATIVATLLSLVLIAVSTSFQKLLLTEGFYNITSPAFDKETLPEVLLKLQVKLYTSSYAKNSLVEDSPVWKDISGHKDVSSDGPIKGPIVRDITLSDATFNFDTRLGGIQTKGVVFTGPQSVFSGLRGNRDFTIFWYAMTRELPAAGVPLVTFFANTSTNVGLSLSIIGGATPGIRIVHTFTSATPTTVNVPMTGLVGTEMQLFGVSRLGTSLFVFKGGDQVGDPIPVGEQDILLSNKPFVINPKATWDGVLGAFGITAVAAAATDMTSINTHIVDRRSKLLDSVQKLILQQRSQEQRKACLWTDKTICNEECSAIDDWTDVGNVLATASPNCRSAIDRECATNVQSANTDDILELCRCWRPTESATENCQLVRSFFNNSLRDLVRDGAAKKCTKPSAKEPSLAKYYDGGTTSSDLAGPLTMPGSGINDWYPALKAISPSPLASQRISDIIGRRNNWDLPTTGDPSSSASSSIWNRLTQVLQSGQLRYTPPANPTATTPATTTTR
jgi:hypothetical protein